ncbi:MAG: hypothetical protein PHP42_09925 [Bacteroidota bacterium]|nr:hypothetical protein [Bacteroidota bacterium]
MKKAQAAISEKLYRQHNIPSDEGKKHMWDHICNSALYQEFIQHWERPARIPLNQTPPQKNFK